MSQSFQTIILASAIALALCVPASGQLKVVQVKIGADSEAPGYEAFRAMDGDGRTMWHTMFGTGDPVHPHELLVDLGGAFELTGISYLPRQGGGNGTIKQFEVLVSDDAKKFGPPVVKGDFSVADDWNAIRFTRAVKGRYVKLRALSEVRGQSWASVAELQIESPGVTFRSTPTDELVLPGHDGTPATEAQRQYATLWHDLKQIKRFAPVAHQAFDRQALILETDRDPIDVVLRRTAALLDDLQRMTPAPDMNELARQLDQLHAEAARTAGRNDKARFDLFERACQLRRRIALANPLLNFDKILFIKRHRSTFNHMCDQYYGANARPGGGLFVLEGAFGEKPTTRDVLADSVVANGRLKGQRLIVGSFLSPELSFDGKTIVFAYVECSGDANHRHHTDPTRGHWHEGRSYHLFKVNADGSGLQQLTDGTWNDFSPCWLPNGRIAFISERRGGYLRCGRVCPTYTLYDMAADGSQIRCLSFHETNEWDPSVTHDGRIVWTRWDYVDRHGCTAHMPWITGLDGADPRAIHGNYSPRQERPDMELNVRAIPGSHRFVATAAPHHGQAFGSLVIIDPAVPDDDRMAPVKRLTPEVGFPESQGGAQVYGTAWPLSEKYHLCVYDPAMQPALGRQGGRYVPGNYGIYLVDAFGNKELIYRDPEIACMMPIPLRPRKAPDVTPPASALSIADDAVRSNPATRHQAPGGEAAQEATVSVINVRDSQYKWPDDVKIKSIRVLQVLPMTVPSGNPPHETGLRSPSAGDSVVLARAVLGTAPVEADGSAHFVVPAYKEILFQALDERGLAVQSMRSATQTRAGEHLSCQGCHAPSKSAPPKLSAIPLALRRAPSRLTPGSDGSAPFSYPRLVQPVLDRHCVACHAAKAEKAPDLSDKIVPMPRGQGKVYASWANLAPKYGFWNYGNEHRTTPGQFGARASKLLKLLDDGHYNVKLPPQDLHRITLWLDCVSPFYGVYEKEGGEAQLRGEVVRPTLE